MLFHALSLLLSTASAQTVELHAESRAVVSTEVQAQARVELQAPRLELDPNAFDAAAALFTTRVAIEGGLGLADDDAALDHVASEIALDAELAPLPWLGFGVRAAGVRLETPNAGETDYDVTSWMVTGGPRFTLFTDEAKREAFRVELGAGYRFATEGASDGMILEAAVGRQVAWTAPGDTNAVGATLLVRGQQGLGAAANYRAIFLATQVQWEQGFAPADEGVGESSFRYTFGGELMLGASFMSQAPIDAPTFTGGANLAMGFPLGPWIEPRVRLDVLQHTGSNGSADLLSIGALGGVRLRMNEAIPFYLDAYGGYAFVSDPPGSEIASGPIADFGLGIRYAPCNDETHQLSNSAWTFGVRTRIGLHENDGLDAIYGTIGYEYGAGSPVFSSQCGIEEPEPIEVVGVVPARDPTDVEVTPVPPTPATSTVYTTEVLVPETEEVELDDGEGVRIPLRFGVEGMLGWFDADYPTSHFGGGVAFPIDVRLTRHFALGMRLNLQTAGDASSDTNLDRIDDVEEGGYDTIALWGGPRLLLFSDEADRQGWTFDLDAGWIWGEGENGPAFEVVIGRQVGGFLGESAAADLGLSVRYQQGLFDMADYRAVLFGASMSLEFGVLTPEDDAGESSFDYLFGAYALAGSTLSDSKVADAGSAFGGGLEFGVPITAALVPMIRAEILARPESRANVESPSVMSYAGFAGARMRFDEFIPLFVDAGIGYGASFGSFEGSVPDGGIADFAIGTNLFCIDSDSRFQMGVRGRVGVTGNREADGIFFTIGGTYAGGEPMFGRDSFWCRIDDAPSDPDDYYVPSGSSWTSTPEPSGTATEIVRPGETSTEVEVIVTPPPPVEVHIEPPPPTEVIIEIPRPPRIRIETPRIDIRGEFHIGR
jgi:hypothetical protein